MKKRYLAGLLAAVLLVCCAACQKAPAQQPDAPELPDAPDKTQVSPQLPENPEPAQPEEKPDETPEDAVEVAALTQEDTIDEVVSYRIAVPQITLADPSLAEGVNGYYRAAAGKLADYAWGELYESAQQSHSVSHLEADYEVGYNQEGILSVFRRAAAESSDGESHVTCYAETFSMENGGLFVADDFFTLDTIDWSQLLIDAVTAKIQAMDQKDVLFESGWQQTVAQAFDKDQFYLRSGEEGLEYVVFYQEGELGEDAPNQFAIPVSELDQVFCLPK